MVDLNKLNKEQREAAETIEGPLLILAGAGSGKTRVLTYRIAYLIENGVYPGNIIAITFTNKAAAEMKERVESLIDSNEKGMWISTFHSACVRILRQDIDKIGFNKNFVIYDTQDQEKLIKECLKDLNLDEKIFPPKEILSKIGSLKDVLVDADYYYKKYSNDYKNRRIAEIYELYQKKLKSNNALDFDDIIMNTVKLLKAHPDILSYYQRKFRYILVDEYQDTNKAQYEFVNLLAKSHRNLCVVGDDDQSIYGWRGADVRNILDFEKDYPDAKVIKLEENYRSTKKILDAANFVIQNNEQRKEKRLWTKNQEGENIKLYRAGNEREEADFIVNEIMKLTDAGRSYSDFAVLYRTNAMSRIIEEAFVTANVPYRVYGGLKFYDRKEVKDILSYLKFVNNPLDNISLERIVNTPKRGIGDATLEKIRQYSDESDISLFNSLENAKKIDGLGKKVVSAIIKFTEIINNLINQRDSMKVSDMILEVLEKTGYQSEMENENTEEANQRLENLKEFYSAAVEFEEKSEEISLGDFLERVALVSDTDDLSSSGCITLMTLHTAKGLEFPAVFIAGMEEGIFPHYSAQTDMKELEEERRLCYVGITRAKEVLYLTCARVRLMFGRTSVNPVSSFVSEIPEELIDEISENNGKTPYNSYNDSFRVNRNISGNFTAPYDYNKRETSNVKNYANREAKRNKPKIDNGDIKAGIKIMHKSFGKGIIIAVKDIKGDKQITVHFDNAGLKNLLLSMSPIEKIQ